MTTPSWAVDLGQYGDAMQTVLSNTNTIMAAQEGIQGQYATIEGAWRSPAGTSFTDVTTTINTAMSQLVAVLDSIYEAMKTTQGNYVQAEQENVSILNFLTSSS
jgi:WXG100 family type VII secretion target